MPLAAASVLFFFSTFPLICDATSDPLSYVNKTDELPPPVTSDAFNSNLVQIKYRNLFNEGDNEINVDEPKAQLKNAALDTNLRWPNAVIPYVISPSFCISLKNLLIF